MTAADESRRHAPRGPPHVLDRLVAGLKRDVERLREILPEIVRRAGLQRPAIAHQRLDRVRAQRARQISRFRFSARDDRHRQYRLAHVAVEIENLQRFLFGLGLGFVRGVPFLPEKLGRPQERARDLFPADDVRPLIQQHRKVAPRLDPLGVHRPENRLGGRADDQPLFEFLAAAVRHVGDLRREPLHVFRFLRQQALGDEQRKVRVHVAGGLDAAIERLLDQLPDRIAVRADDHAALDGRIVGELCAADDVQIPAREVLRARGDFGDEFGFVVGLLWPS